MRDRELARMVMKVPLILPSKAVLDQKEKCVLKEFGIIKQEKIG